MRLIIGGYAQGRLAYVLKKYHLTERDVLDLADPENPENPDFLEDYQNKKIIYHAEYLVRYFPDPENMIKKIPDLTHKIIITQEVGCGLVPIDPDERRWREAVGRMNQFLAQQAQSVERVCCGLGMYLKQDNKIN